MGCPVEFCCRHVFQQQRGQRQSQFLPVGSVVVTMGYVGAGMIGGLSFPCPTWSETRHSCSFLRAYADVFTQMRWTIGWLYGDMSVPVFHMVPTLCKSKASGTNDFGNMTMRAWNLVMVGAFCNVIERKMQKEENTPSWAPFLT